MKTLNGLLTVLLLAATSFPSFAGQATDATQEANQAVRDYLPFDDNTDFKNAERGFIATIDEGRIMDDKGGVIFDMKQFDFLDQSDPDTVNPSLWRQSKMNAMNGLYKVSDGIYQVRGFDLANISFIRGKTGWIVIDPLTAKRGFAAARQEIGLSADAAHIGPASPVGGADLIKLPCRPVQAPSTIQHQLEI